MSNKDKSVRSLIKQGISLQEAVTRVDKAYIEAATFFRIAKTTDTTSKLCRLSYPDKSYSRWTISSSNRAIRDMQSEEIAEIANLILDQWDKYWSRKEKRNG